MFEICIAQKNDLDYLKHACCELDTEMTKLYEELISEKIEAPVWEDNSFDSYFTHKDGIILIAKDGEKYVGIAMTDFLNEGRAQLAYLIVDLNYRGKGIGTRLIDKTKKQAKKFGFDRLTLNVLQNNGDAKKLYEKEGFHDVKTIMSFKL